MKRDQLTYTESRYREIVNHRVLKLVDLPYNSDSLEYSLEYRKLDRSISKHLSKAIEESNMTFGQPIYELLQLLHRKCESRRRLLTRNKGVAV